MSKDSDLPLRGYLTPLANKVLIYFHYRDILKNLEGVCSHPRLCIIVKSETVEVDERLSH